MYRNIKKYLLLSIALLFSNIVIAVEDKIVASVESEVITDTDIAQRYELLKALNATAPSLNPAVRQNLLEQLIEENVIRILWDQQAGKDVEIATDQEIESFAQAYSLEHLPQNVIKDYYQMQRKRQIIAREQFGRHVNLSHKEVESYISQGFDWNAVSFFLSYKIAYDDKPFDEARALEQSSIFLDVPSAKVPHVVWANGFWKEKERWHFFEHDGEHVALYINDYQLDGLLEQQIASTIYFFEGSSELSEDQLLAYKQNKDLPDYVKNAQLRSLDITHRYQLPDSLKKVSSFKKGDVFLLSSDTDYCSYFFVDELTAHPQDFISHFISQEAREQITYKRVEQSFQLWLAQMRSQFFVKLYERSTRG